jgi:hypothetical protein
MGECENGRMGEWENGRMGEWENAGRVHKRKSNAVKTALPFIFGFTPELVLILQSEFTV